MTKLGERARFSGESSAKCRLVLIVVLEELDGDEPIKLSVAR